MTAPTITEAEARRRERVAFEDGAQWAWPRRQHSLVGADISQIAHDEALRRYPTPLVTRPRVVQDPQRSGFEWRCVDGVLQSRYTEPNCNPEPWRDSIAVYGVTAECVALLHDIVQNPTEQVPDDRA